MKILVSACLLGENCKYNGGNNYNAAVAEFVKDKEVLTVCPEMMASMGCPRTPIEIVDGILMNRDGKNVDAAMRAAVAQAIKRVSQEEIGCAVLQSRSPTCGVNQIYDGTFSGKLISGSGIFAQALQEAGYQVIDAEDLGAKGQAMTFYEKMRIVCMAIPQGKVSTYGQIAMLCGKPKNARQVGYGLRENLAGEDVPAFRVVNGKGELSGAHQFLISDLQKTLLEEDSIEVLWNGKRWYVDLEKYGWETTIEDAETFRLIFEELSK